MMRWLVGIINLMNMNLSKLQEIMKDRCLACCNPWGHKDPDRASQLKNNKRYQKLNGIHSCTVGELFTTEKAPNK